MKFYIDNLGKMDYSGLTMQNLKLLKRKIEAEIESLNAELDTINKALEIQSKHAKPGRFDIDLKSVKSGNGFADPEEIEKAIMGITGDFQSEDVPKHMQEILAGKTASSNAIGTALHQLIKAGKLQYVRERAGRRPAIYRKAGKSH